MKRRMVTLAIVGAMAVAAMAPATVFASGTPINGEGQTAISYTVGGEPVTDDGSVVVMIPAAVELQQSGTKALDLTLKVRTDTGYVNASTGNPSGVNVAVTVHSTNGFKVIGQDTSTEATYEYKVGSNTLSNTSNSVGTLNDTTPELAGTVGFVNNVAPTTNDVYDDLLTFTLTTS